MSDAVAKNAILVMILKLVVSDCWFTLQRDPLSGVKYGCDRFGKTAFFREARLCEPV